MIRDLLNPSSGFLDLREDSKGVIQVAGITEVSTINAQEVRQPTSPCMTWLIIYFNQNVQISSSATAKLVVCVFRSWNCWWRATNSAPRSQPPPIRRRLVPMLCCRWPSSSRAGVETSCRRSASHASSWSTSPAPNEQHRCVYIYSVRRCLKGWNYV